MIKKFLSLTILVLFGNVFLMVTPKLAFAGTIIQISYGPSDATVGTYVGASSSTFITFTPIIALILDSTVTVTFPSGTTLTSGNIATSDFRISQATSGVCVNAGADTAPSAISVNETDRTITFTLASTSLSKTVLSVDCGLGQVTIKTSASFGSNEIRHPTTSTSTGGLSIDTSILDTGSISNVSFVAAAANSLSRTSGNSQSGTVSSALSNPFVVIVADVYSNAISGTTVTFAISSSPSGSTGASLSTSSTTTNSSGQASTTLTLGNLSGTYTVTASVAGLVDVIFSATALSAPSLTSLSPSTKGQGANSQNITITGGGFESGATASFSGSGITVNSVTFNSSTSLTANITVSETALTTLRNITVTNSDGETSTGSNLFTVTSRPLISSISISRLEKGDTNQEVTITGENFSGSSLDFGSGLTVSQTTTVSSTKITAKLSVASDATYGNRDVVVVNSDGGRSSPASFKVAPELTITSIKHTNNSSTSTTITWTTSNKVATKVVYGTSIAYGKTIEDNTKATSHSIALTNLPTYWVHYFKIVAEDEYGQIVESLNQLFTAGFLPSTAQIVQPPFSSQSTNSDNALEENLLLSEDEVSQKARVTVEIAVFNANRQAVPGVRVEIHSTPRVAYTDKDGVARFPLVEKGKHTIFFAYNGLLGQKSWEVLAASTDNNGIPLEKVAIEMNSTVNAFEGWFANFLFGIFGGLVGALLLIILFRHQFSKKTVISFIGFIVVPLILMLIWIVYSWYERR